MGRKRQLKQDGLNRKRDEKMKEIISCDEWIQEGAKLFGEDRKKWRFKCPSCGNIQSYEDFEKLGIEHPENYAYFSCIGRFLKNSKGTIYNNLKPCNYTNGGLFCLAKLSVKDEKGKPHPVFEFAKEKVKK